MDVGDLLRRVIEGDQRAWDELVGRFGGLVWSIARGYRLGALTDDVVQTVWLRLAENCDRIRDPERLAAWLATTTRNEALPRVDQAGADAQPSATSPSGPTPARRASTRSSPTTTRCATCSTVSPSCRPRTRSCCDSCAPCRRSTTPRSARCSDGRSAASARAASGHSRSSGSSSHQDSTTVTDGPAERMRQDDRRIDQRRRTARSAPPRHRHRRPRSRPRARRGAGGVHVAHDRHRVGRARVRLDAGTGGRPCRRRRTGRSRSGRRAWRSK